MPESADLKREIQIIGGHVLDLLARAGEPSPETLEVCVRLFESAGEPVLVRWAGCEIAGYGGSGAMSLKEVLGVADDSHLASRVRAYRQHVGQVRTAMASKSGRRLQLPYFFGESVETLRHYRANADAIGVDFLEVELLNPSQLADPSAAPQGAPARTLEFPRYVFYRILSGLGVELEMVVRSILKRFASGAG
jgi:hypothetical protein